jgi:hypothetical protein
MSEQRTPPPPPATRATSATRAHPRFELLATVELRDADETVVLPARNLSRGGIFLASDGNDLRRFAVGSTIELLVFDGNNEEHPVVRGRAAVVRHDGAGMGLRWLDNPETDAALVKLLTALKSR